MCDLAPATSGHIGRHRNSGQAKANIKTKTRSRNGCPTCKAKRLKCDETKPECVLCIKNGRKCPGYSQAFRWSTKHEKRLADGARGPDNLEDLVKATSETIVASGLGSLPKQDPVAGELVSELACSTASGEEGGSDPDMLSVDASSILTPNLDDLIMPDTEYSIDNLLQDIWQEEPTGEPTPLDAAIHDCILFDDQSLAMATTPARDKPLSPFWGDNDPLSMTMTGHELSGSIPCVINDRSSLLVEEWFRHVCSMWSSFDSEANLNRKLAWENWTRSEAVMYCLQSMSAACLSSQMPHMRQVAVSCLREAVKALDKDIKVGIQYLTTGSLPTELLLALCCVGTAACWIDTKELGGQFLREAKTLLKRATQASGDLSLQDRETLSFFNNSLIYWNMLVAVVSDEDNLGIPKLKERPKTELSGPIVPHPWTGVSATAQRLFAQAIRLCRRFRRHLKIESISTVRSLQTALRDISEAQEIEEELLGLEHYSLDDISDTGDRLTPKSHFIDVAEGYRLASLLQLYQTFPDLVSRRLPEDSVDGGQTSAPIDSWDRWIVPLGLRLISILKKIPPSSGTRCIQPLLYLSASTGLRFDAETIHQQVEQLNEPLIPAMMSHTAQMDPPAEPDVPFTMENERGKSKEVSITRLSIEVSHARRFVLERLSALEHSLPPAPVRVARQLVKAIWAAYDSEKPGRSHAHWIDVMEESDLRTIFG